MSRRGRSAAAARPPLEREDEAPLSHDVHDHAQVRDDEPESEPGQEPADDGDADGHEHEQPTPTRSRPGIRIKRETRFGIAALLSFVILVTVLVMNKGSKKGTSPSKKGAGDRPTPALQVAAKGTPDSPPPPKGEDAGSPNGDTPPPPDAGTPEPSTPAPEGVQPASNEEPMPPLPNESGSGTPLPGSGPATDPAPPEGSPQPGAGNDVMSPPPMPPPTGPGDAQPPLIPPETPSVPEPSPVPPAEQNPQAPPLPQPVEGSPPAEPALPPASPAQEPPAQPTSPVSAPPPVKPAPAPAAEQAPASKPVVPDFSPAPGAESLDDASAPPRFRAGTGIPIPNAGKNVNLDESPGKLAVAAAAGAGAGVAAASQAGEVERVESLTHVVASGENFYTISRKYYGSGRYYMSLWKANSKMVLAPAKLRVGTRIVVPPPEALDRSLIEPPRMTKSPAAKAGTARAPVTRPSDFHQLTLPVADVSQGPGRVAAASAEEVGGNEAGDERPAALRYRIKRGDSLQIIARETLGDSGRAREILDLNRRVIDDPRRLIEGQVIQLPEGAQLGRRTR